MDACKFWKMVSGTFTLGISFENFQINYFVGIILIDKLKTFKTSLRDVTLSTQKNHTLCKKIKHKAVGTQYLRVHYLRTFTTMKFEISMKSTRPLQ